ncbi:ATP-grasp domain-containing protein [Anatilimnocola sp. NA78]|uniref:ATP-grasp domain-containing protein n=1 Tax=Anatilimnocola sp. NA78 TaxID=3415683 RepID=UPI003CE4F83C
MIVVFPCSADSEQLPDSKFLKESMTCEELGIEFTTVNLRAVMRGDLTRAFLHTANGDGKLTVYRGGTLRPDEYRLFHQALRDRGLCLLTAPEQYDATQLFPCFFPHIAEFSIPAIATTSLEPAEVRMLTQRMGPPPYFIKDFIKSAKEIWPQGCVIPSPGNVEQFATVIQELREFREDRFIPGLVLRPLIELKSLGPDPFGDERFEEYRMIFLGGRRLFTLPYGHDGELSTIPAADFQRFDVIGQRINSPFFMADSVVTATGEHFLLETGDGGCCGLPPGINLREFYQALQGLSLSSDP